MKLQELADRVEQGFNVTELRDLFFQLDIDYDDVPGITRKDKVRELILYLNRRSKINDLVILCEQLRPNLLWNFDPQIGSDDLIEASLTESNKPSLNRHLANGLVILVFAIAIVLIISRAFQDNPSDSNPQQTINLTLTHTESSEIFTLSADNQRPSVTPTLASPTASTNELQISTSSPSPTTEATPNQETSQELSPDEALQKYFSLIREALASSGIVQRDQFSIAFQMLSNEFVKNSISNDENLQHLESDFEKYQWGWEKNLGVPDILPPDPVTENIGAGHYAVILNLYLTIPNQTYKIRYVLTQDRDRGSQQLDYWQIVDGGLVDD